MLDLIPVVHLLLHRAQVHGLGDDKVIIMKAQGLCVHRLVERPGVARMFLVKKLPQHFVAILERLTQSALGFGFVKPVGFLDCRP